MSTPVIPRPVPLHFWGPDHWSTFGYAASIATSEKREIEKDKMRTDGGRHPYGVGHVKQMLSSDVSDGRYPTRLRHAIIEAVPIVMQRQLDPITAGLLTWGTWTVPWVVLTDAGLAAWTQLQAYENDPAVRSWRKAMEGWMPSTENRGLAETGDAIYTALA